MSSNEPRVELGDYPICPNCGAEMFPIDDHGRFRCPKGDDPDSNLARAMAKVAAELGREKAGK